jgi:hypothetical protein
MSSFWAYGKPVILAGGWVGQPELLTSGFDSSTSKIFIFNVTSNIIVCSALIQGENSLKT